MATTGQLNTNIAYDSYFWVYWSQQSQDIASNKTRIYWSCGATCGHDFYSNAIKMSPVSINGTQVYGGGTYSNFAKGEHRIAYGYMDIPHNADGSKTFSISAFTGWLYSNHNYSSNGGSFTLTTIPRQATVTDAQDFNDEGNPTVKFSNVGGFQLIPYLCFYLNGVQIIEITRDKGSYTSPYTWKLTDDERKTLRELLKNDNVCGVTEGFYTYVGDEELGYNSIGKTFSIVNANPVFTDEQVTYEDTNKDVTDVTDNPLHIVQNQSSLAVTITDATGNKGANITEYTFLLNGVTKTATKSGTFDFGTINSTQDSTLYVTAKDSRGNTTTIEKKITILPWSPPIFTATLERLNNYEDTTYLTVDASVSSVNSKNTMSVSYRYKESGGDYGNPINIENKTQYEELCDKNKAYIFSITVEDAFDSTTHEFALSKGKFPLFIDTRKNAVGINDFPAEGEALRVAEGVAHFTDGVKINNEMVADYIIEQGISGIWTYRRWASGIAECRGIYAQENVAIKTPWGVGLYESTGYSVDLPSGLFVDTPQFDITLVGSGGTFLQIYSVGSKLETPHICAVRPEETTVVSLLNTSITAFGRWK